MGTALITGASAGLGAEFAWALATNNHNLVLVARREDRLRSLAEKIRGATGVDVEVLPADLATREGLDAVVARLRAGAGSGPAAGAVGDSSPTTGAATGDAASSATTAGPVGLLVNNAGFGLGARFLHSSIEEEERALDVMVRAVLVLSHAATTAMTQRGHGAILNISSMAEGTAMGSYAAHKAWVRSFTESLATELAGTGVTATAVLPGLVRTEFHATAGMKTHVWPEIGWLSADQVVTEALHAVNHGRVLSVPSLRYKVANGLVRFAPRSLVRRITGSKSHSRSHGKSHDHDHGDSHGHTHDHGDSHGHAHDHGASHDDGKFAG